MLGGKIIAAGLLPICSSTGKILLVRRNIQKGNNWAMFGGKFEEGIDQGPKDAAKREFMEESGFVGQYQISTDAFHVYEDNHISFYTFLGVFEEEFIPCGKDYEREHLDYCWFNLDMLPENLHPELKAMLIVKHKALEEKISELLA